MGIKLWCTHSSHRGFQEKGIMKMRFYVIKRHDSVKGGVGGGCLRGLMTNSFDVKVCCLDNAGVGKMEVGAWARRRGGGRWERSSLNESSSLVETQTVIATSAFKGTTHSCGFSVCVTFQKASFTQSNEDNGRRGGRGRGCWCGTVIGKSHQCIAVNVQLCADKKHYRWNMLG